MAKAKSALFNFYSCLRALRVAAEIPYIALLEPSKITLPARLVRHSALIEDRRLFCFIFITQSLLDSLLFQFSQIRIYHDPPIKLFLNFLSSCQTHDPALFTRKCKKSLNLLD